MVFMITGSGTRIAEAFDGEPDNAPLLVIEYEESSGPTIIVNSTMTSFHTEPGTPSAAQSYSVSGINLTGDISLAAPEGFEISTDNSTFSSSVLLSQSGGEVSSTDIFVRLTGAEGSWSGDITHDSDGASQKLISISGTCAESLPWVAYNDLAWESGQLETNITKYTITSGSDTGLLVDYATGADTPVTATITSSGDLEINTGTYGGAETASGTDAYELFHGIVDMPGVLHYGDLGWWVEVTFTDLNPLSAYVFATSANRDGSSYDDRVSKFIIQDVDSAVNTSSAGAAISTTSFTDDTTVFCTGNNTDDGYIARWSNVEPGADGDFTVRVESNSSTDEHAYGFSVFMLGEEGPTGPGIGTSVNALSEFTSAPGAISSAQSYTVSGTGLSEDITITAPAGFLLSLDDYEFVHELVLTQSGGEVSPTTIFAALYSETSGSFSGDIVHSSAGVTPVNVAVSGEVSSTIETSFQQGVDGYAGTVDTFIMEDNPDTEYGEEEWVEWDGDDPYGEGKANYGLLMFADIFGTAAGQIPPGVTIQEAVLTYVVNNSGDSADVNEAAVDWSESVTYGTFGSTGGVQAEDYGISVGTASGASETTYSIDVTASIQRWLDGEENKGWIFRPTADDGVEFFSSEHPTAAERPLLEVIYNIPPTTPYINASGTVTPFNSGIGVPSDAQSYTVSGSNLVDDIVITAPADFQISLTGASESWGSMLSITPVEGAVAPQNIYVRFLRSTAGTSSGNISHTSTDAATLNIPVSGTAVNQAPNTPVLVQPDNGAEGVGIPPTLEVSVSDPENDALDVSFYGRPAGGGTGTDFLFIAVPDTQMLAQSYPTTMYNQFQWIANQTAIFVTHLGDIVNSSSSTSQWEAADSAYDLLDTAGTPYSVGPGNHDIAYGTTFYPDYFGSARFAGAPWYQGYYTGGSDNYNNYSFFSASGMDFIVINLQYNATSEHHNWADSLLKANPDKRGIVVQHNILNTDDSWQSQAVFTALKDNPNLFLLLCGHMHTTSDGSAYRAEQGDDGHTIHILLTDYQEFTNNDNVRLLTFKPNEDVIFAQVYSPQDATYLTSASNYEEFNMAYDMEAGVPFELIGTVNDVTSGSASISWPDLVNNAAYEWYVEVSDAGSMTPSDTWSFTTQAEIVNQAPDLAGIGNQAVDELVGLNFVATATDDGLPSDTLTFSLEASGTGSVPSGASIGSASGAFNWTPTEAQGPGIYSFDVCVSDGSLSDCETISVTVNEVNVAPVLQAIGNKSVEQGEELSFTAAANDIDDPSQILTFSLGGTAPASATITSGGDFSWTTAEDQTLGDYTFDVCVSDGLLPVCETIIVTVTEGTIPPPTPSSYYGEIHFISGDGEPSFGDSLEAYLDDETTPITSVDIGESGGVLNYAINVPTYADMSYPATVRFEIDGRVVAISDWVSERNLNLDIHPPKADAGGAYAELLDEASLTLTGSAEDYLLSDTISYAWDLDGDGEYDDSGVMNPVFDFTTTGTHEIGLRVTDSQGGEGFDSTQIFIVELSGLEGQVYDGNPHAVTVEGVESPYTTTVLYGDPGSETPPSDAGTHDVVVNIMNGEDLLASVQDELVIAKATATVTLGNLSHVYDGTDKEASATTVPAELTVTFTYDGSAANPTDAGSYAVVATVDDDNYEGSAEGTLEIAKAAATVTLDDLSHVYDGSAKEASATTVPTGLTVTFTYDGSAAKPTDAGSYAVVATVEDANYEGSTEGTLVISKATATVTLDDLSQVYDGTAKEASANTVPVGLTVIFTYDGSAAKPTDAGSYAVVATVEDANYEGSAEGTLEITKATATVTLGDLNQTYDGTAQEASATTVPAGLTVTFTYDGSATKPTDVGSYAVVATVEDANYEGSAEGTLEIEKATATVTLDDLSYVYDGTAKEASATTVPVGLTVTFTYDGSSEPPTDVGSYAVIATVVDDNYEGTAEGTLVIAEKMAVVTLGDLSHVYDGTAKEASATTDPEGLMVTFTYDGSAAKPIDAGSYTVVATVVDDNYAGSAEGTLVIAKATATVTLSDLSHVYDGTAKEASATTIPAGLTVTFTYDGSATKPTDAGSYAVVATVVDDNYAGSAEATLVIAKATATVTLSDLSHVYDGAAKEAIATTIPVGLTVTLTYTYDGSVTKPTDAGSYAVVATVDDANYEGSAEGTLVIAKATATVTLSNLSHVYDGTAKEASATTVPVGLTVTFTYDGSSEPPTEAGSYAVIATVVDDNYEGTAEGTLEILYQKHGIDLLAGWNLVSFNVHPASTEIEDVLGSIDGLYSLVYAWDAETDTWLKYDPNVEYGRTLLNLDETMGFWIKMSGDATLFVEGTYPEATTISLSSDGGGWNLVGFPSAEALGLPEALEDHGVEDASIVFAYKAFDTDDPWKLFESDIPDYAIDLIQLDAGWGYWIKVLNDANWQIDY
jgi:hypothetical protein